jgi:branched-subunit amino acid aminotransferase/4-amino-4-deoxychorismate lyase
VNVTRIEIDGAPATAERLWETTSGYGHFTAMQVRDGGTRGIELHLRRLRDANREAFGAGLDGDRVRALIRHALGDTRDASVRVHLYEGEDDPVTVVTVKGPAGMASPQRLRTARYQRPRPHIKHVVTDQGFHRRQARAEGFDDALLMGPDGLVSETTLANIGFFDGATVVWPDAPMLHGITMQLLERELAVQGAPARRAAVRPGDIAALDGAFVSSARGIGVVTAVDDLRLPAEPKGMGALAETWALLPWDRI